MLDHHRRASDALWTAGDAWWSLLARRWVGKSRKSPGRSGFGPFALTFSAMNEFQRLKLLVRTLAQRVEALESARQLRAKRTAAPRPDNAVVSENRALWDAYLAAEVGRGIKRITKCGFAAKHNLPEREFRRLFSYHDQKGIKPGSGPFVRMRTVLIEATAQAKKSPGRFAYSPIHAVKTAV
jgi:hypothetical protein